METRFLLDRNLGRLAKWLRVLGYDTVYDRGNVDISFIHRAETEQRIALIRKKNMVGFSDGMPMLIIVSDRLADQIEEVLDKLELHPDPARRMTRCLLCNALLAPLSKQEAGNTVPDYVQEKYDYFRRCPLCGRTYWSGTHVSNIEKFLNLHSHVHRPGSFRWRD
jgi:uncharacterized protein with PIN domain